MSEELYKAIGRLRRSQPINNDTMAVCDALEGYLFVKVKPVTDPGLVRSRFDKNAYQREYMRSYMRRRRAKEKGK
jgi:hypothetical protein